MLLYALKQKRTRQFRGEKMYKSVVLILAALVVLSACKPQTQNVAQELSTSELESVSADLDQLDTGVNEAEFESLDAELAELESLEYG